MSFRVVSRRVKASRDVHLVDLSESCSDLRIGFRAYEGSIAEVILNQLDEDPDRDVLYVDPMSGLRRRPEIFDVPEFDIAAYVHQPSMPVNLPRRGRFNGIGWIYPSTIFFRQSQVARDVLRKWIEENERRPDRDEIDNLRYFLADVDAVFQPLPVEYSWVERAMRPLYPEVIPFIENLAWWLKGTPDRMDKEIFPSIVLSTFAGLGDAFYLRPAVKKMVEKRGEVYLKNPWPQFFADIPGAHIIKPPSMNFRVQKHNMGRMGNTAWASYPTHPIEYVTQYGIRDFQKNLTPIGAFMKCAKVEGEPTWGEYKFSVPEEWVKPWMRELPRPLGIVRASTIRKEWKNTSRNPDPAAIQHLVRANPWINWLEIGWLDGGQEILDAPRLRDFSWTYVHGQLSIEDVAALMSISDVSLSGVCFVLPMAAAVGGRPFTIFGGSIPPDLLIEPCMGKVGYFAPTPFCPCFSDTHECNKTLDFDAMNDAFREFMGKEVIVQ